MADISITPANVFGNSAATVDKSRNLGATVTAGQAVYLDTTNNVWMLANAVGNASVRQMNGIALNGGSSGQPCSVLTGGIISIGATVVQGKIYVLSNTSGGIAPSSDLATNWYTNIIGTATNAAAISVQLQFANTAV